MANQLDKFGIKQIYPTRSGGREWFIRETLEDMKNDSRAAGDLRDDLKSGNNTDGFKIGDESQVRVTVAAESTLRDVGNTGLDQSTAKGRGYAFTKNDWHVSGLEWTARFKCTDFDTADSRFIMKGPTGSHHSNTQDCSGTNYGIRFFLAPSGSDSGTTEWLKEQWHVHYVSRGQTSTGLGSIFNKWVVAKMVLYKVKSSDGKSNWMKMEAWLNVNNDGITFKKVNETVDSGGWNDGNGALDCGADRKDEIMTWDSARMMWRWDGPAILFKDLSVREIDPTGSAGEPAPPPTTGTASKDYVFKNNIIAFPIDACNLGQDVSNVNEFYSVDDNGSVSNLHKERYRVGIVANGSQSFLIGKVPRRVVLRLAKDGSPPAGAITCVLRRGDTDEVAVTFTYTGVGGTLDATALTGTKTDYTFENLTSNYTWQNGDRLNVEYSANTTDTINEINVFRNTDDPVDGRFTCIIRFDSGGIPPIAYSAPDQTIDYAWKISEVK